MRPRPLAADSFPPQSSQSLPISGIHRLPPPEPLSVVAFLATMPVRYHEVYDGPAVLEHARIVGRRRGRAAHVEICRDLSNDGETVVCVVADDRPGLLSLVSAALVLNQLDVTGAQAYCRMAEGEVGEAVDLVWLRRSNDGGARPIDDSDIARVANVLVELVEGSLDLKRASDRASAPSLPPPQAFTSSARFLDGFHAGLSVLVIESDDRPGFLLAVSRKLFEQRVQIARSEVTTAGGRAVDRFHLVEFDGGPINARRREKIVAAVRSAIDAL